MMPLSRSVLFVEHDSHLRDQGAQALREAGFDVQTAFDGDQAMLMMAATTPDVVIVDMMSPEVNGFQLLQAIRETFRIPAKVVMTSEYGSEAHRAYASVLGVDAFFVKPYSLDALCRCVASFVDLPDARDYRFAPTKPTQPPSCATV